MNTEANQQPIMNERIEYRIPEGLILKKSTHPAERDVTIFDALAVYAGLRHVRRNIYADAQKNEYFVTKFGFRPTEQYNPQLQTYEINRERQALLTKVKHAQQKSQLLEEALLRLEDQLEDIQFQQRANEEKRCYLQEKEDALREKERELQEREKKAAPFLMAHNDPRRSEEKKITNERDSVKQANSAQPQPKNPVMMQATQKPAPDKPLSTDLDWTAFNDLLKQLVA
ncbi:MAG: hypothetical protein ACK5RG_18325 [Cyclobacteriaceae bacterium]|jgi:hypothetical protein|nr:hypothetical protein [Flammeovirgaceae bacterium]